MLLTLECSYVKLDVGFILVEVRHLSWLNTIELKLFDYLLFHFLFHTVHFLNRGSSLSCQSKSLLGIAFIFTSNGIDCGLSTLLLIIFNICERLFVHVLGCRPGLDLSFDLLRRWDHLGLGLGQVEGFELRAFRLLLFLGAL